MITSSLHQIIGTARVPFLNYCTHKIWEHIVFISFMASSLAGLNFMESGLFVIIAYWISFLVGAICFLLHSYPILVFDTFYFLSHNYRWIISNYFHVFDNSLGINKMGFISSFSSSNCRYVTLNCYASVFWRSLSRVSGYF